MYSREQIEQAANGFMPTPDETAAMIRQLLASEDRLREVVEAYGRSNPMRTADMHFLACQCLRCCIDRAREALK
jgi:hypothetical protein